MDRNDPDSPYTYGNRMRRRVYMHSPQNDAQQYPLRESQNRLYQRLYVPDRLGKVQLWLELRLL